jgi:putative ABC transport system permease protein
VVLLVAGGLLLRSLIRVLHLDVGFQAAHVITQNISLVDAKYGDILLANHPDRGREGFIAEALRGLASVPGVDSVGVASQIPLGGQGVADPLSDPDRPEEPDKEMPANYRLVSPDYWNSMGIRLEQGRFFRDSDRDRKVAILSSRAAQLLWPNENPIGKRVRLTAGDPEPGQVIGIVRDVRTGLEEEPPPTVYEPYWSFSIATPSFVVRTKADPLAVMGGVRAVLHSIDPDLPIPQAKTMEQIVDESVASRRFETSLAVALAIVALALASLGIYGVISFTVARRTPEMGIRIALGARNGQLMAMVLRQGMTPVLVGLAAGVGSALGFCRFLSSQLYGVTARDPMTIAGVAILLLAVAACACWIPARRASKIDPLSALRFE